MTQRKILLDYTDQFSKDINSEDNEIKFELSEIRYVYKKTIMQFFNKINKDKAHPFYYFFKNIIKEFVDLHVTVSKNYIIKFVDFKEVFIKKIKIKGNPIDKLVEVNIGVICNTLHTEIISLCSDHRFIDFIKNIILNLENAISSSKLHEKKLFLEDKNRICLFNQLIYDKIAEYILPYYVAKIEILYQNLIFDFFLNYDLFINSKNEKKIFDKKYNFIAENFFNENIQIHFKINDKYDLELKNLLKLLRFYKDNKFSVLDKFATKHVFSYNSKFISIIDTFVGKIFRRKDLAKIKNELYSILDDKKAAKNVSFEFLTYLLVENNKKAKNLSNEINKCLDQYKFFKQMFEDYVEKTEKYLIDNANLKNFDKVKKIEIIKKLKSKIKDFESQKFNFENANKSNESIKSLDRLRIEILADPFYEIQKLNVLETFCLDAISTIQNLTMTIKNIQLTIPKTDGFTKIDHIAMLSNDQIIKIFNDFLKKHKDTKTNKLIIQNCIDYTKKIIDGEKEFKTTIENMFSSIKNSKCSLEALKTLIDERKEQHDKIIKNYNVKMYFKEVSDFFIIAKKKLVAHADMINTNINELNAFMIRDTVFLLEVEKLIDVEKSIENLKELNNIVNDSINKLSDKYNNYFLAFQDVSFYKIWEEKYYKGAAYEIETIENCINLYNLKKGEEEELSNNFFSNQIDYNKNLLLEYETYICNSEKDIIISRQRLQIEEKLENWNDFIDNRKNRVSSKRSNRINQFKKKIEDDLIKNIEIASNNFDLCLSYENNCIAKIFKDFNYVRITDSLTCIRKIDKTLKIFLGQYNTFKNEINNIYNLEFKSKTVRELLINEYEKNVRYVNFKSIDEKLIPDDKVKFLYGKLEFKNLLDKIMIIQHDGKLNKNILKDKLITFTNLSIFNDEKEVNFFDILQISQIKVIEYGENFDKICMNTKKIIQNFITRVVLNTEIDTKFIKLHQNINNISKFQKEYNFKIEQQKINENKITEDPIENTDNNEYNNFINAFYNFYFPFANIIKKENDPPDYCFEKYIWTYYFFKNYNDIILSFLIN
ncbi:hypothetical protein GVAV_000567 [Gurleya vavrai]